jgi:hypothetical protein
MGGEADYASAPAAGRRSGSSARSLMRAAWGEATITPPRVIVASADSLESPGRENFICSAAAACSRGAAGSVLISDAVAGESFLIGTEPLMDAHSQLKALRLQCEHLCTLLDRFRAALPALEQALTMEGTA